MSNLEWFFLLMIVIGLAGIYLVYRHDSQKAKS
jgi:hypothetical protein